MTGKQVFISSRVCAYPLPPPSLLPCESKIHWMAYLELELSAYSPQTKKKHFRWACRSRARHPRVSCDAALDIVTSKSKALRWLCTRAYCIRSSAATHVPCIFNGWSIYHQFVSSKCEQTPIFSSSFHCIQMNSPSGDKKQFSTIFDVPNAFCMDKRYRTKRAIDATDCVELKRSSLTQ